MRLARGYIAYSDNGDELVSLRRGAGDFESDESVIVIAVDDIPELSDDEIKDRLLRKD